MKKIIYLCAFVLLSIIYSAESQTAFKAKDGLATATTEATKALGDPELFFLGTITGQIQGVPITISYDMKKGTSNIWAYMFRSKSKPDSTKLYAVMKIIIVYQAIEVPASSISDKLPFTPTTSLGGVSWMDSDKLSTNISSNTDYIDFVKNNSDANLQLAGLGMEPTSGMPYWGAVFQAAKGSLNCIVEAVTGLTQCMAGINAVDDISLSKSVVFPNPASSYVKLNLGNEASNYSKVELVNSYGAVINSFSSSIIDANNTITLGVNELSVGLYYFRLSGNHGCSTYPFVINR